MPRYGWWFTLTHPIIHPVPTCRAIWLPVTLLLDPLSPACHPLLFLIFVATLHLAIFKCCTAIHNFFSLFYHFVSSVSCSSQLPDKRDPLYRHSQYTLCLLIKKKKKSKQVRMILGFSELFFFITIWYSEFHSLLQKMLYGYFYF